jgi:hypothetical protein
MSGPEQTKDGPTIVWRQPAPELNCSQNFPAVEFFLLAEREGTKSSSNSGQPTALEFTSKIISLWGP